MRVRGKFKKRLHFKLFILALLSNVMLFSQTATDPLTNSNAIVDNNPSQNAFYAQITPGSNHSFNTSCCGNDDWPDERVIVTYEKLNLTLTSSNINELKNSTSTYSDGGTAPDMLEYGAGLVVGDVVNVYMVYLNNDVNRRGSASGNNYGGGVDYGEVTFEGDILAVGFDWQHTLWFSDTDYGTDDYPKWSFANQVGKSGKFEDRKFEPEVYSFNGVYGTWIPDWNNTKLSGGGNNGNKDWFRVLTSSGVSKSPNYNGSVKKFQLGCSNGAKGDFFRVITKSSCTEPTGTGSIGNPQSGCGSFDPNTITNSSSGSGGSGGTPTYFWQYSTSSSSGPWINIGNSNSSTYNPSSISQTTWYRRGYYRCDASAAIYTSAVEMTVNPIPTASASA